MYLKILLLINIIGYFITIPISKFIIYSEGYYKFREEFPDETEEEIKKMSKKNLDALVWACYVPLVNLISVPIAILIDYIGYESSKKY